MGDNETSTCGYEEYLGYAGISISAFVICDSVLTIVTICRTRVLHTNQYIFIASLAVADILMSMSFLVTASIRLTRLNSIIDEQIIVKNLVYGTTFSFTVLAGLHMGIIAVDRYIRIAHPFYYIQNMTTKRTIKILSITYILCLINACIPAVVYQNIKYKYCITLHQPVEYFYANIILHFINISVVFVCYYKIARIAISHKKAAMSRRMQTEDIANTVIKSNRVAVMRSVRFFVAMYGVYFILSVPPFVMECVAFYRDVPAFMMVIGAHCFPLHSVLNFVICCSLNHGFRKAIKRTFADLKTCCFRKCYRHSI